MTEFESKMTLEISTPVHYARAYYIHSGQHEQGYTVETAAASSTEKQKSATVLYEYLFFLAILFTGILDKCFILE